MFEQMNDGVECEREARKTHTHNSNIDIENKKGKTAEI